MTHILALRMLATMVQLKETGSDAQPRAAFLGGGPMDHPNLKMKSAATYAYHTKIYSYNPFPQHAQNSGQIDFIV